MGVFVIVRMGVFVGVGKLLGVGVKVGVIVGGIASIPHTTEVEHWGEQLLVLPSQCFQ